jgi:hypothetical protein
MKNIRNIALVLFGVFTALIMSMSPASAATGNAWDITSNGGSTCTGYLALSYRSFTAPQEVNVWRDLGVKNRPDTSSCHEVGSVRLGPADNVQACQALESSGGCQYDTTIRAGSIHWVVCWKYGETVHGWNKWDKLYEQLSSGIRLLGYVWDGGVTQAVTWPQCA